MEAALSPANQPVLLRLMAEAETQDCPLIVSTSSPCCWPIPARASMNFAAEEAI